VSVNVHSRLAAVTKVLYGTGDVGVVFIEQNLVASRCVSVFNLNTDFKD